MASGVVLQQLRNDITQLQLAEQQSHTQLKVGAMCRGAQALVRSAAGCWLLHPAALKAQYTAATYLVLPFLWQH